MGRRSLLGYLLCFVWSLLGMPGAVSASLPPASTYTNPLPLQSAGGRVESCPDPAIIHGQQPGDTDWYLYCTTDPHNGADRNADGTFHFHLISMFRSPDLIHWTDAGDAFAARPHWMRDDGYLWAPDIEFFNGRYYLYYTATETNLPDGGSAIGVATSASPTGPWSDSGTPAVEPQPARCCENARRWVFDPLVIADTSGQRYLFYGSYRGGIAARRLSANGLQTDPASETQITVANRYEGASIVRHGGFYYLFVSATNCCNGPLTGYSVFAGRASTLLGPYTDREGVAFLDGQVGGTPVLTMNGNRWVGPGHNTVFTDFAGQDWFLYHAIDRTDPYFAGAPGFTKRPVLLDPLDWLDGWPTVRGGLGTSDTPQPTPAAQPGGTSAYTVTARKDDDLGLLVGALSDEFNTPPDANSRLAPLLGRQWHWVRPPAPGTYGLSDGTLRFATQATDLFENTNTASVLTEAIPDSDYTVETRVRLDVPQTDCCQDAVQAGLVIYGDDDNYIKLVQIALAETRQTEFSTEHAPVPPGYPRYGTSVVGPPAEWTYLRIVKRTQASEEWYTAYTSRDGTRWVHGGTWTHHLGRNAKIGLVAMGGAGYTANFDYIRVYAIAGPFITPRLGSG